MIGSDLHEAASELAARRVPVFACIPGQKKPATPHGFKDASTDPAVIDAWWEADEFNVALSPGDAGWAVLDVDPDKGGMTSLEALEIAHGPIRDTLTVRTPSGGLHLYFEGTLPRNTASKLGPGLDTRSIGGYVLVPPSVVDGVAYEAVNSLPMAPLPQWLAEAVVAQRNVNEAGEVGLDLPWNVTRFREHARGLAPATAGSVNEAGTSLVGVACDMGLTRDTAWPIIVEAWGARCSPPFGLDDKLYDCGLWTQRQNTGHPLALQSDSAAEVFKQGLALEPPAPDLDERVRRFRGRDLAAYANLPPPEYHDPYKLLPKQPGGALGMVVGQSGAGKTTAAVHLALEAIKLGSRVLYLAGEGAFGLGRSRLPTEAAVRGIDLGELGKSFRLVDVVPNLSDARDIDALLEAHADFGPNLIFWDTLATAIPGLDENSAATASHFTGSGPMRAKLGRAWNATNVMLHHLGKDPSKGGRGTSGFEANADFVHVLTKAPSALRLHAAKMRDAADDWDVFFRVSKAGGAPVASAITADEFKALSPVPDEAVQRPVYEALKELCASGATITTHVLATHLTPPEPGESAEDYAKRVNKRELALTRWVRPSRKTGKPGPLAAYVRWDVEGDPITPFEWVFPGDPEADDD